MTAFSAKSTARLKVCNAVCKDGHQAMTGASVPLHSVASLVIRGGTCCFYWSGNGDCCSRTRSCLWHLTIPPNNYLLGALNEVIAEVHLGLQSSSSFLLHASCTEGDQTNKKNTTTNNKRHWLMCFLFSVGTDQATCISFLGFVQCSGCSRGADQNDTWPAGMLCSFEKLCLFPAPPQGSPSPHPACSESLKARGSKSDMALSHTAPNKCIPFPSEVLSRMVRFPSCVDFS